MGENVCLVSLIGSPSLCTLISCAVSRLIFTVNLLDPLLDHHLGQAASSFPTGRLSKTVYYGKIKEFVSSPF